MEERKREIFKFLDNLIFSQDEIVTQNTLMSDQKIAQKIQKLRISVPNLLFQYMSDPATNIKRITLNYEIIISCPHDKLLLLGKTDMMDDENMRNEAVIMRCSEERLKEVLNIVDRNDDLKVESLAIYSISNTDVKYHMSSFDNPFGNIAPDPEMNNRMNVDSGKKSWRKNENDVQNMEDDLDDIMDQLEERKDEAELINAQNAMRDTTPQFQIQTQPSKPKPKPQVQSKLKPQTNQVNESKSNSFLEKLKKKTSKPEKQKTLPEKKNKPTKKRPRNEANKMESPKIKRLKLQESEDEDESKDEMVDIPQNPPSPKNEEIEESPEVPKRVKKTRKVKKTKTYTNDKGYLVTEDLLVDEEYSSEYVAPKPIPNKKKNQNPLAKNPEPTKRRGKAAAKNQTSLFDFMNKK